MFVLHVLLILNSSILQVHLAINRLGLSTISPFNPKERVALIILDLDMCENISYLFILEMVKLVSIKSRFLFVQYFPQVIEYSLPPPEEPQLIDLTVRQFVASVPISSRFFSSSSTSSSSSSTCPNNVKRCSCLSGGSKDGGSWRRFRVRSARGPWRWTWLNGGRVFEIVIKFVFFSVRNIKSRPVLGQLRPKKNRWANLRMARGNGSL